MELTKRQTQVLILMAKGLEAKQIAAELRITESTAKERKQVLFRRLGAVNSCHAIAIGKDLGLI